MKRLSSLIFLAAWLCGTAFAQVINFPVGSPVGTSGAGNARTDSENFFVRNNVAGMTEISREETETQRGQRYRVEHSRWRINSEVLLATYNYRRERIFPGPAQGITSETRLGTHGFTSEVTYTSEGQRIAFGLGAYTVFGFQSKLKDPPEVGPRGGFFDTRVASNDFAAATSVRVHKKLSVGGSFIFGRGFVDLAAPNALLASRGIARQDRLDVSAFGAPGVSIGVHIRPTDRLSFALNYRTRRSYDLEGTLQTWALLVIPVEPPVISLKPDVNVKLKLPAVAEGGVEIKATRKWRLFADYRFYDYSAVFQQLEVKDRASQSTRVALKLDAYDVRSFRLGSVITLNDATKLSFGSAYTNNGFPAAAVNGGTMNVNGVDISAGISRRLANGPWLNIGAAGIIGLRRTIQPTENPLFAGRIGGTGGMLGFGLRW